MKKTNFRLFLFVLFTGIFLFLISLFYWKNPKNILIVLLMLTPGISTIVVRLLTKEGGENLFLKPNFKKSPLIYFAMYLFIPFLACLGIALYFFIFPDRFSPTASAFAIQQNNPNIREYRQILLTQIPLAILLNPIFALPSCLGEELGWRGYLLPKLCEKYTRVKSVLISSFLWGIWHAPVVALMGLNYGSSQPLILRILMQILLCLVLGFIFSYTFFKTGSVWPAVLGHAAINGLDKLPPAVLFMKTDSAVNPIIGPGPSSLIGLSFFSLFALYCFFQIRKMDQISSWKAE